MNAAKQKKDSEKPGLFLKLSTVEVLIFTSSQDPSKRVNSLFSAEYQAKIVNIQFGAL